MSAELDDGRRRIRELEQQLAEAQTVAVRNHFEYWVWQGDGLDELETLTCPVLIRPEALLSMLKRAEAIATALEQQLAEVRQQLHETQERLVGEDFRGSVLKQQRDELLAACKLARYWSTSLAPENQLRQVDAAIASVEEKP